MPKVTHYIIAYNFRKINCAEKKFPYSGENISLHMILSAKTAAQALR